MRGGITSLLNTAANLHRACAPAGVPSPSSILLCAPSGAASQQPLRRALQSLVSRACGLKHGTPSAAVFPCAHGTLARRCVAAEPSAQLQQGTVCTSSAEAVLPCTVAIRSKARLHTARGATRRAALHVTAAARDDERGNREDPQPRAHPASQQQQPSTTASSALGNSDDGENASAWCSCVVT